MLMNRSVCIAIKRLHKGFSLLEWIIFVGCLALLLSQIVGRAGNANDASAVSGESAHISTIANSAKSLHGSSGFATGDLYSTAKSYKVFPPDMKDSGTSIQNVWGGSVVITGAGNYFTITYNSVPQQACAQLASQLSISSMFYSTTINGSAVVGEVAAASAATMCTTGNNIVIWQVNES
jgi:hypothetical protein